MAKKLASRDTTGFLEDFRSIKATNSKLPHAADSTESECEILKFGEHFEKRLKSSPVYAFSANPKLSGSKLINDFSNSLKICF